MFALEMSKIGERSQKLGSMNILLKFDCILTVRVFQKSSNDLVKTLIAFAIGVQYFLRIWVYSSKFYPMNIFLFEIEYFFCFLKLKKFLKN